MTDFVVRRPGRATRHRAGRSDSARWPIRVLCTNAAVAATTGLWNAPLPVAASSCALNERRTVSARTALMPPMTAPAFNSDSAPLNCYLREQVARRRAAVAACFVAWPMGSASRVHRPRPACCWPIFQPAPAKLLRYPTVPAVRMGRLAIDQAFKGQGLGRCAAG